MILLVIILLNLFVLDIYIFKCIKKAKQFAKMNDYLSAFDLDDEFWQNEED